MTMRSIEERLRRGKKEHRANCASLCTNTRGDETEPGQYNGCQRSHECWCPDGGLSYAEYEATHPKEA